MENCKEFLFTPTRRYRLILSILLWRDIVENGYKRKQNSKWWSYVAGMKGHCPLCEVYSHDTNCDSCCPLNVDGVHCGIDGSHYNLWAYEELRGASLLLKRLEEVYKEEFWQSVDEAIVFHDLERRG